jgi:hypothetical protein
MHVARAVEVELPLIAVELATVEVAAAVATDVEARCSARRADAA